VPYIVVALNKVDMVEDAELLELVEMEVREKYFISRHKEFAHLSILDKEHLIVEAKNKLEDITLFANLFFIISTSMLILKLLIV